MQYTNIPQDVSSNVIFTYLPLKDLGMLVDKEIFEKEFIRRTLMGLDEPLELALGRQNVDLLHLYLKSKIDPDWQSILGVIFGYSSMDDQRRAMFIRIVIEVSGNLALPILMEEEDIDIWQRRYPFVHALMDDSKLLEMYLPYVLGKKLFVGDQGDILFDEYELRIVADSNYHRLANRPIDDVLRYRQIFIDHGRRLPDSWVLDKIMGNNPASEHLSELLSTPKIRDVTRQLFYVEPTQAWNILLQLDPDNKYLDEQMKILFDPVIRHDVVMFLDNVPCVYS